MNKRLSKREKQILDNLDRLLAGESLSESSGFVEDKIFQALKRADSTGEALLKQQNETARLISDLAHQIKTPLSALSLHLELAEDEALSAEEQGTALKECRQQAERIRFLTQAMFKVSRLESGLISVRRQPWDLCRTIMGAVESISPAAVEKGLSLSLNLPKSLTVAHDPVWTGEAILNILDNGVKYTEHGGLSLSLSRGAIYTRLDIADTGPGISPRDYPLVFARFYRGNTGAQSGTGLGLSIAREILRQQGGNITVESPGKGCIFSLFLQNC